MPPPDSALASTTAPLPSASVAPAPTLKAGLKADKLLVPPVIVKVAALPTLNEKAGAPAVKSSVLIVAAFEMVTAVGAPLLVKVAVPSGTVGEELQLVPVVHSPPGPSQVPSTAWAVPEANAVKMSVHEKAEDSSA